jgi:hypothetical protein
VHRSPSAVAEARAAHPAEDLLRLGIRWLLDGLATDARDGDPRVPRASHRVT